MNPDFNDPFSDAYDAISMHRSDLPAAAGCRIYAPDNQDDYSCLAIWQPAPELGAKKWTRFGTRILLGIYRDEGRVKQRMPLTAMTYSISSGSLTVTTDKPHRLSIGDQVELAAVNDLNFIATVSSSTRFSFTVAGISGNLTGGGQYSPVTEVDFYNDYLIFRLLPSFKPIPVATALEILAQANPENSRVTVTLTDIATGTAKLVSEISTRSSSSAAREHRQQLNELSAPLTQNYDAQGQVIAPNLRFSKTANAALYLTVPLVNQHDSLRQANLYLPAFDYYGFSLNDIARSPFFNNGIIYYDEQVPLGLMRASYNSTIIYTGFIHDTFGDFVVGALANNTLVTRKPVQPLLVDQHNTPYKAYIFR